MVFKREMDERGRVAYYKAQLVAKRLIQKECIDYLKTFTPFVPFEVLLLLVGKCIAEGWHVHPVDISTAFLTSPIDCKLFVSCDDVVHKLSKSL